jgi:hypothetical protein
MTTQELIEIGCRITGLGVGAGLLAFAACGYRRWDFDGFVATLLGLVGLIVLVGATSFTK